MKILLFALITSISLNSFATTKSLNSAWFGTFSKKTLNQDYSWWSEAQLRYSFDNGEVGQFLYRTGLLKSISKDQGVGLLYAFITTNTAKEHRWTFQHTQTYMNNDSFSLSSRARLEYRNLENNSDDSWRSRYLLRFEKENYILWNEIFLNLTAEKSSDNQLFERNRFFVGKKLNILNTKVEYGYLNQYVPREDASTVEHLVVLYLFM
jgi:hypothetical protein